ncbi:MAG: phosphotransferase [Chloroflexota bacterium]|nr:phosphotransferase [Chloroflexota bacterium]
MTDHFMERYGFPIVDTTSHRSENFTTLIGAELHGPGLMRGPWHILAVGLPFDFAPAGGDESGPDVARRASEAGAFVVIAHPAWYTLMYEKAKELDFADAIEVFNFTCLLDNDRGESWYLADQFLMTGRRPFAIATDDTHNSARPDTFGGWTMVRSESLDPDSLLAALRAGHFYASTGPELHDITVDSDKVRVSCSEASAVFITGPGSLHRTAVGDRLTGAEFPLEPFATSYCRVTIQGADGGRAWSNPIFFED